MPKTKRTPQIRTPPGKGLRVKIKGPWTAAIRSSLRRKKPPEGWPKDAPAASSEEE